MVRSRDVDKELMRRLVGREANAMIEFRDRYYRVVIATGVRMLRSRPDAEDVAQDVLMRVWIHAHTYDHAQGSLLAWVVQITRNRAIDLIRQNRAWCELPDVASIRCCAIDAERLIVTNQNTEALRSALASVPDKQRVLLEHAYFSGLSHSELARSFGLPLGTVKTRMRLGLVALKHGYARARLISRRGPTWRAAAGLYTLCSVSPGLPLCGIAAGFA